ncbi:putative RNA cytidine acetyltransferase with specificity toward both 18S rRNA and tRNAs [Lyophyllum shimeji]|uniref:RNA cytidine acetyltransferase with specificity toward both 18S rRNA and tRNAs n=1 Tax=Lyophyllum shimeji TaxID=47721 RepID=A0A9P3Q202_LYOSH|nr:putative RNA cytidine acetyltransferase with specificity toward both 18S rRNA and tRNAs [Lyophyllum shimeji]
MNGVVLPISRGKDITPLEATPGKNKEVETGLKDLKSFLEDTKPVGDFIKLAKTIDQAQAILTFIDAIAEKTLSSTVTLTAARGRGKSAALGLALAAALAHGYFNIFVTNARGYEKHLDYDIAQSTNLDFDKAIVRYIQPEDAHVLGDPPTPGLVKSLISSYLVFMASIINGYEGTGCSLSLKLIQQLRESTCHSLTKGLIHIEKSITKPAPKTCALREIELHTLMRYSAGDKVEKWLNTLLCLDALILPKASKYGTPHPSGCELFYVSRDTLFSFHPASKVFLQRMMALYVASDYKNQPNDLQLLSDAPRTISSCSSSRSRMTRRASPSRLWSYRSHWRGIPARRRLWRAGEGSEGRRRYDTLPGLWVSSCRRAGLGC